LRGVLRWPPLRGWPSAAGGPSCNTVRLGVTPSWNYWYSLQRFLQTGAATEWRPDCLPKLSGCGAMVAHQLPKLRVAGSSPVARSSQISNLYLSSISSYTVSWLSQIVGDSKQVPHAENVCRSPKAPRTKLPTKRCLTSKFESALSALPS